MNLELFSSYVAPLIGFVTLAIGIAAVAQPRKMSSKFGIPAETPALPYVTSVGIRDVFMGTTILVLFYRGDRLSLGVMLLGLAVVAAADFTVVRKHGIAKVSLVHLAGAVAVTAYGLWILLV